MQSVTYNTSSTTCTDDFHPKSNPSQYYVKNYRPVSLLDIQGKILDIIIYRWLKDFLEINNIPDTRQQDFRQNKGTHTVLAAIYETVVNNRNEKSPQINIVLRYVSKVFNEVWHTGLKFKIITLYIHNCFKKILCNFLDYRKALIRIEEYIGAPFPLHSGVPRGAGLSPTLYAFCIHDLPPPTPYSEHIAYADDITQIISCKRKSHLMLKHNTKYKRFREKNWKLKQTKKNSQ